MNEEEKKGNNTYIHLVIGSVFGPVEQHIEAAPREGKAKVETEQAVTAKADRVEGEVSDALPAALDTPRAKALLGRLVAAGLVDERWQPLSLSNPEKGVLASLLADRLGVDNLWQTFGGLWGMKSETLRSACNLGMGQRKTMAFMERVKGVMEGESEAPQKGKS